MKYLGFVVLLLACSCTPQWSEVEYNVNSGKYGFDVIYTNSEGSRDTITRFSQSFTDKYWIEKGEEVDLIVIAHQDSTEISADIIWDDEVFSEGQSLLDSAEVFVLEAELK